MDTCKCWRSSWRLWLAQFGSSVRVTMHSPTLPARFSNGLPVQTLDGSMPNRSHSRARTAHLGVLTDPRQLAQWTGANLEEPPRRPVLAGDRFILRKRGMRIRFQVFDATPFQLLSLRIQLPFGILNHEQIQLTVLNTSECRVSFN